MTTEAKTTYRRVSKILDKISALHKELHELQEACTHPKENLNKTYKSNTGNYDPSSDCYWAEYKCDICNKFWIGDQQERKGKQDRY